MRDDSIINEIRKIREEHAASLDYDLERIFKELKEREAKSGHKVVSLPPRRLETK